jgi:hypothetical protein
VLYGWVCGYPGSVLRSTAAREIAPLRRLQFVQINSHWHVWMFKSPQHTLPKKITKKNIMEIEPLLKELRVLKCVLQAPDLRWYHADVGGSRWPI